MSAILGALVGAILGLTGAGGGILAVPALSFGMGLSMQEAAPVALIAVAIGAGVGALEGFRHGLVRYRAAILIAMSSFPFVYFGQAIARQLSQTVLQASFACVMLVVAYRLVRHKHSSTVSELPFAFARTHPDSGKFIWTVSTAAILAGIGSTTGLLTGLLGVGGGFVIVPLLRKFTQVSVQGIVATSLMVIALVGSSGVASALIHGVNLPLQTTLIFTVGTVFGMLLGRKLIKRIAPAQVQRGFSILLMLVALGMLLSAAVSAHN